MVGSESSCIEFCSMVVNGFRAPQHRSVVADASRSTLSSANSSNASNISQRTVS